MILATISILPPEPLPAWEVAVRIMLAFIAGALLGWERESHGRAAGLRTTILASVASAIAIVLSDIMFQTASTVTYTAVWRPDPARMAQGILTGIGFLGAGTILRDGKNIRGITTAATLWFATILGIAFGLGHLLIGVGGAAIAMVTLHVLPDLESGIKIDWYACVSVRCTAAGPRPETLRYELDRLGAKVRTMALSNDLVRQEHTATFEVKLLRSERFEIPSKALAHLSAMSGILSVTWE